MPSCAYCGKEFVQRDPRQRFCSRDCRKRDERSRPPANAKTYTCEHCGKEFKPKSRERVTFCSRECYYAHRKPEPKVVTKPVCPICGREFEGKSNQRYCSEECRKARARLDQRRRDASARVAQTKTCLECGRAFLVEKYAAKTLFCSKACARRHNKHQREAKRRKQFVAPVYFKRIYDRDQGRCQICGKKVSLKHAVPHPMAATLDHIIPLSCGGTHEPKNVQLAHFICNSLKSAGGHDQLRLIG